MVALADSDISRSNQGAKSATNGAKSKGRPRGDFTAEQTRDAKAVWRNVKDYRTWADAAKAMPEGFTPTRAFKLWQGRMPLTRLRAAAKAHREIYKR